MLSEAVEISNNATHLAAQHIDAHFSPPSPTLFQQTVKQGGEKSLGRGKNGGSFVFCYVVHWFLLISYLMPAFPLSLLPLLLPMVGWWYSSNRTPDGSILWVLASSGLRKWGVVQEEKLKQWEIKRQKGWGGIEIKKKWKRVLREEKDGIIKGECDREYHAAHAEESWSDYKSKCLCYISVQIFWQYIACFPRATWQLAPHQADRCTVNKDSIFNLLLDGEI